MSTTSALILYPSWALAVLMAATAARLGRAGGRGLLALCLVLALWITAVLLTEHPATSALAEHVIPFGMLLAGAFVHGGTDVTTAGDAAATPLARRLRLATWIGYGWGVAVGTLGALAPSALYGPGMTAPGPGFWPLAAISAVGAALVQGWMVVALRSLRGPARRRMALLLTGNVIGLVGGGGAILLRVLGLVTDLRWTAPWLLVAVVVTASAVLGGEAGRDRRLLAQSLVVAAVGAALTAPVLALVIAALPALVPAAGFAWLVAVVAFVVLPLDAVRQLVADALGRRLFRDPIGVRDLADEAARSEARADHAERLAEIGVITSAVAHEVRNPLGVIAAQAKLLERAGAPASSVAALRVQVDRARRFVDDLLRYGQPRPLDVRDVELAPVIDGAVSAVRQAVADAAPIGVDVPAELRAEVDRAGLGDVLVALVQNAAIAAGDRAGAAVRVGARAEAGAVVITVEDDGPGVPAELVATLFAPFVTGRGRDHRHPGTGLGLAIARRVIERHGGTLGHEVPARGGARFVIRLPRGGPGARQP